MMTRAVVALVAVVGTMGLLSEPAFAAQHPSVSWAIPTPRIDAGSRPFATFIVRMPRHDHAVLQKRVGTGHVWRSVAVLHPRHGGNGNASAPSVAQGAHFYRIVVVGKKHRVVARSRTIEVFAYANVALATITGKGTQIVNVNGQPFTYDVGVFATETNGGVADTPAYNRLVAMPRATCRSITLTLAAPTPNAGESGGTVAVSVVQENSDPATIQLTGNQIAPFTATLTGAAWELHASSLVPDSGPYGPHELDIAANGTLSCYTPSGT
jgi:hypothetical protein